MMLDGGILTVQRRQLATRKRARQRRADDLGTEDCDRFGVILGSGQCRVHLHLLSQVGDVDGWTLALRRKTGEEL